MELTLHSNPNPPGVRGYGYGVSRRLHIDIVIKRAPRLERPWLEPLVVSDFTSKSDLIDANLA